VPLTRDDNRCPLIGIGTVPDCGYESIETLIAQKKGIVGTTSKTDATPDTSVRDHHRKLTIVPIFTRNHREGAVRAIGDTECAPGTKVVVHDNLWRQVSFPDPRNEAEHDPHKDEATPYDDGREPQTRREQEEIERIRRKRDRDALRIEGWQNPYRPDEGGERHCT